MWHKAVSHLFVSLARHTRAESEKFGTGTATGVKGLERAGGRAEQRLGNW